MAATAGECAMLALHYFTGWVHHICHNKTNDQTCLNALECLLPLKGQMQRHFVA
jgi:hypothetical protein